MSYHSKAALEAASGSLLGMCVGAVGLRIYTRKLQRMPFKADDAHAVFAVITFTGLVITLMLMVHEKLTGYPYASLDPKFLHDAYQRRVPYETVIGNLNIIALVCTKLSAVYFYRRIFSIPGAIRRWFEYASLITVPVVVLWGLIFIFLGYFQCGVHFDALWEPERINYCEIVSPMQISMVVTDFCLDIWLIVLPMPIIINLHTSRAGKLSISGVFLLAFVGLGASIGRMISYINMMSHGTDYAVAHDDTGVVSTEGYFFSVLELGMSLFAVNLPTLWYLRSKIILPEHWGSNLRAVLSVKSRKSSKSNSSPDDKLAITKNTTMAITTRRAGSASSCSCDYSHHHDKLNDVEAYPIELLEYNHFKLPKGGQD